ncbi:MAG: potassium transporter TrkG [Candidatus Omnitrophota bacterium]
MGRFNPPQLLILSFLSVILIGAAVLSLPVSSAGPEKMSVIDSLFTATSATCVTGLAVKDTGSAFSPFGRWVIFFLFQSGGLGIMTFSTLFAVLLGRKIGFYETDVIKRTLDGQNILGLKKLFAYILGITILAETVGATFLFFRWRAVTDWSIPLTIERAVFHSVSAFCNAGFSLFRDSFTRFAADPVINLTMILLIFLGGIGFIVIMDVLGVFYNRKTIRRISLQTKLVFTVSAILIITGAILIFLFERGHLMKDMSFSQRFFGSLFQSVTARTAGFNSVPVGELSVPSLTLITFLMFIGASPGSTGGGIKTCTMAVIAATVFGMLGNRKRVMIFSRSIPRDIIREAMAIFFLALAWIFVFTMIIAYSEGDRTLIKPLFEVVSAFGTVGLSTGITAGLNSFSKLCIILTMFAGRVGPLTLMLAVAFKERKESYIFPEENIMVG